MLNPCFLSHIAGLHSLSLANDYNSRCGSILFTLLDSYVTSLVFLLHTSVFTISQGVLSFSSSSVTDLDSNLSKSFHYSVSLSLWIRPGWIIKSLVTHFFQWSHEKMPSLVCSMILITAVKHLESYCWEIIHKNANIFIYYVQV